MISSMFSGVTSRYDLWKSFTAASPNSMEVPGLASTAAAMARYGAKAATSRIAWLTTGVNLAISAVAAMTATKTAITPMVIRANCGPIGGL